MTTFHAVMTDECGGEFGVTVTADNADEAYEKLRADYPESGVAQLEDPAARNAREHRQYSEAMSDELYLNGSRARRYDDY